MLDNVIFTNYIEAIPLTNRPPTFVEIDVSHTLYRNRVKGVKPRAILSVVGVTSGLRQHVRDAVPPGVVFAESCHPRALMYCKQNHPRFLQMVDAIKKAFK